jgi:hypothetical protein
MSVEHKYERSEDLNRVQLVITIEGSHDIYRFAHHMLLGQVEFSDRARKILVALKRRMGTDRWRYLDRSMGGWQLRGDREPPAPPTTTTDETAGE